MEKLNCTISCLWSSGQKILHEAPGQHPHLNTTGVTHTRTQKQTSQNLLRDYFCKSNKNGFHTLSPSLLKTRTYVQNTRKQFQTLPNFGKKIPILYSECQICVENEKPDSMYCIHGEA